MEMRLSSSGFPPQPPEGERRVQNSELWHACAGPLVSLPAEGTKVVYFPQGHSEHVAVSTNKDVNAQIPNYPCLPPQLICHLHNLSMHADTETDEVYAQMTLQPLSPQEQKELYLPAELGSPSKQPTNYFCKTLTASDTSTHGGFSVPRRAAEKVFPPLDYTQQPPVQELVARDLHDNEWRFRHVFRGQPKRHLLTTGWSVFVSAKKLVAGDSILFIWNEKNQLHLGVRRANRPPKMAPSSVLSSDSMHLGLLAAAAHAASSNSPFTIIYNPRAGPSEFVIPLAKYIRAVYNTRVSIGMRFRMLFETEESSVRRYMGTITGISDLDADLWPNSHWRSVKVGWDESTLGERQARVSLWEIEPLTTFPMYPSSLPLGGFKRPWPPALPSFQGMVGGDLRMTSPMMWVQGDGSSLDHQGISGGMPWLQPRVDASSSSSSSSMFGFQADTNLQAKQLAPSVGALQNNSSQTTVNSSFMLQQPVSFADHHQQNPLQSLLDSFPQGSSWAAQQAAGVIETHNQEDDVSLPPFPGREEEERSASRQRHGLYGGGDADALPPSSMLMMNGVSSAVLPPVFASSNFVDGAAAAAGPSAIDFSSSCMGESSFMYSQENAEEGQFVKVYKSGFVGRSLNISKFNNYNELRSELAQMYGLQQDLLEDPVRSGWQLVFVDRENDVVLLGDGPWPEFVNSVSCIKILSPEEVQQMGKSGLDLLNSNARLPGDDGDGRQDSSSTTNFGAGPPCIASLDY